MELQKQFFLRFLKENNLYNKLNDSRYSVFISLVNSLYVNIVSKKIFIDMLKSNKCHKMTYNINEKLLYDILPNNNHRIIISDIKDIKKLYKYFDKNGIVWCSFSRVYEIEVFNGKITPKYLCLQNGLLSWANSEFWTNDKLYTYSFFTEETFYPYWDSLKEKFKRNFKSIITC